MKKISFLWCLMLSLGGYSQVIADPALDQVEVSTISNTTLDPITLPLNGLILLRIPILNLNTSNGLPAGSCKIKIGLGSKLVLDPEFNLTTTSTSAYFDWTAEMAGGQVQLTGDLKAALPPGFSLTCAFRVKGSVVGNSTVTSNFLVTNHNTAINLSDENPANNTSFLAYTVVPATIPVTFTRIAARSEACNIKVDFSAEAEINVDHYEIEAGKDGIHYIKMGQVPANQRINYNYSFYLTDTIKAPLLFVRIKSVDRDGRFQYSDIRSVKSSCDTRMTLSLFPNPVQQNGAFVTIRAEDGIFNGRVILSLTDMAGKLIHKKTFTLLNAGQFNYETGHLAAGQYLVKLQVNDNPTPFVLKFQKW